MFCPACNTQNSATSVNCIQCGTTLIYEAKGHSTSYIQGAQLVDSRIYGLVGCVVCLGLAFVLLNTVLSDLSLNEHLVYLGSIVVGGIAGRVVAWRKWRALLQASKSSS